MVQNLKWKALAAIC